MWGGGGRLVGRAEWSSEGRVVGLEGRKWKKWKTDQKGLKVLIIYLEGKEI